MPIHIEEMSSEVEATAGDLPLSPMQIDKLVTMVIKQLEAKQRNERSQDASTKLQPSVTPNGGINRK